MPRAIAFVVGAAFSAEARNSRATQVGKNHELVKSAFPRCHGIRQRGHRAGFCRQPSGGVGHRRSLPTGMWSTKASVIKDERKIAAVFADGNRKDGLESLPPTRSWIWRC